MHIKLWTDKEVAEYLGISVEEVNKLAEEGKIPSYKVGGAFLRFKKEEIMALGPKIQPQKTEKEPASLASAFREYERANFSDKVKDFLYFNNFYIICAFLIGILIFIILKRG